MLLKSHLIRQKIQAESRVKDIIVRTEKVNNIIPLTTVVVRKYTSGETTKYQRCKKNLQVRKEQILSIFFRVIPLKSVLFVARYMLSIS